eukprot:1006454-Pyramimonas_sp.AAC.1
MLNSRRGHSYAICATIGLQHVACEGEQRALWALLDAFLDQLSSDEDILLCLEPRSKRELIFE